MFNRNNKFEGMTKEQLKERLYIIDYEIASSRSKRELKKLYKEIELINKQLIKLKENKTGRRFKLNEKHKRR